MTSGRAKKRACTYCGKTALHHFEGVFFCEKVSCLYNFISDHHILDVADEVEE